MKPNLHKKILRKVVSAAEVAKTSEEHWRLISWGITFEGSMMLKASLQPEIKLTNPEMDVLVSWQAVCSDASTMSFTAQLTSTIQSLAEYANAQIPLALNQKGIGKSQA